MASQNNLVDDIEVKLHRLCDQFSHLPQDTIRATLEYCQYNEERCKALLTLWGLTPAQPLPPVLRQMSYPTSQASTEVLSSSIPSRGSSDSISGDQNSHFFTRSPRTPSVSEHQDGLAHHPTFDPNLIRYPYILPLHVGQAHPPFGPVPRPPPEAPEDCSEVLRSQSEQYSELKELLNKLNKEILHLQEVCQIHEEKLNDLCLKSLQGIQAENLEDKQLLINLLEDDVKSLKTEKSHLEEFLGAIKVQCSSDVHGNGEVWRCQLCTLDNPMSKMECEACRFKRGAC